MAYNGREDGPKALFCVSRVRGQRWHHAICFGRLGHYYEDGTCEHTDAYLDAITDYGKRVVKVVPFGGSSNRPKRFCKRPVGAGA